MTSAALKGAHVSPQVLVATVILHRDSRRKQQTRLLKLEEDKEDFYKTVIEILSSRIAWTSSSSQGKTTIVLKMGSY